jgi:hypothetical protein
MHDIRAENVARSIDREVAALAARQHGVVARRQLEALGLARSAVGRREVVAAIAATAPITKQVIPYRTS